MSILEALIYGIVQGIAEFLPISSTAHLVLLPWIFRWNQQPEAAKAAFDVALHLGTAAAVILFFLKDWIRLITDGFTKPSSKNGKLFWFIVIATIPGGLAGVALDKYTEAMRDPLVIGIMLIIMGFILYFADKFGRNKVVLEDIGLNRSITVGIAQVLAIIPGVSRSGITMSAGRAMGITREGIAKFTFLLSTPIILADGLYHMKGIIHTPIDKAPFIVAVLTSAIVGLLSIKFLLDYLKNKGFGIFAAYRLILGAIVIVLYYVRLKG
ncbi:MAG TPA: undecaprenyl-diphosphate phosphatase [Clostridia bacterium]